MSKKEHRSPTQREQAPSDRDQTAADRDQTAADQDQTASDRDAASSLRDQALSDRDQRASDRDQQTADREHDRSPGSDEAHASSTEERRRGTEERDDASLERAQLANDRADHAARRDAASRLRELTADARDRTADARDQAAAILDEQFDNGSGSNRAVREYLVELRERAAGDRMLAAADRRQAAEDRKHAAEDRRQAHEELRRAHLDDLTGVYRRDSGTTAIQREINRAHHSDGLLVLAFIDVDGLKVVNDAQGHAAGDALLRDVVAALRDGLRDYDPIVRLGGDEFVCALAGATLDEAGRRMDQICENMVLRGGSISVGLTDLRQGDDLETLMERGDAELYRIKARGRRQAAR